MSDEHSELSGVATKLPMPSQGMSPAAYGAMIDSRYRLCDPVDPHVDLGSMFAPFPGPVTTEDHLKLIAVLRAIGPPPLATA